MLGDCLDNNGSIFSITVFITHHIFAYIWRMLNHIIPYILSRTLHRDAVMCMHIIGDWKDILTHQSETTSVQL